MLELLYWGRWSAVQSGRRGRMVHIPEDHPKIVPRIAEPKCSAPSPGAPCCCFPATTLFDDLEHFQWEFPGCIFVPKQAVWESWGAVKVQIMDPRSALVACI